MNWLPFLRAASLESGFIALYQKVSGGARNDLRVLKSGLSYHAEKENRDSLVFCLGINATKKFRDWNIRKLSVINSLGLKIPINQRCTRVLNHVQPPQTQNRGTNKRKCVSSKANPPSLIVNNS